MEAVVRPRGQFRRPDRDCCTLSAGVVDGVVMRRIPVNTFSPLSSRQSKEVPGKTLPKLGSPEASLFLLLFVPSLRSGNSLIVPLSLANPCHGLAIYTKSAQVVENVNLSRNSATLLT